MDGVGLPGQGTDREANKPGDRDPKLVGRIASKRWRKGMERGGRREGGRPAPLRTRGREWRT